MKLFTRRRNHLREAARQLTIYQQRAFAFPSSPPGALPYATYEAMERDSMIQTVLTVKRLGVMAGKYRVVDDESPEGIRRRAFVEEAFERMEGSPATVMDQAMDAFAKGWSVQELVYVADGGRIWIEAARPKDPALFGLDVDAYGRVRALRLEIPGETPETLPRAKFAIYANRGGYGRPKGRSDLEAAYPHWSAKQSLLAAWKVHLERFAMPTVLGSFKAGLSGDDQAALLGALKDLQNNTSLVYPDDIQISTLTTAKEQSTGFMDALDFHNREIARAVLGQTLTTDEGRRVGSLAMGKVHLQVLLLQLQSLRNELADTVMTEQVIRPLVEMNFGPGSIPRFEFEQTPLEAFTSGRIL